MKSIYLLNAIISIFLLGSCSLENEDNEGMLLDPVDHVFHDAIQVEVEDSLTSIAVDVKIVGWKKEDRNLYNLHYKFSDVENEIEIEKGTIAYKDIRFRDGALSENFLFSELDSITEYMFELKSTYKDALTTTDVYTFITKGDTATVVE